MNNFGKWAEGLPGFLNFAIFLRWSMSYGTGSDAVSRGLHRVVPVFLKVPPGLPVPRKINYCQNLAGNSIGGFELLLFLFDTWSGNEVFGSDR